VFCHRGGNGARENSDRGSQRRDGLIVVGFFVPIGIIGKKRESGAPRLGAEWLILTGGREVGRPIFYGAEGVLVRREEGRPGESRLV